MSLAPREPSRKAVHLKDPQVGNLPKRYPRVLKLALLLMLVPATVQAAPALGLTLVSGSLTASPGETVTFAGRITNTTGVSLNATDMFLNFSGFDPNVLTNITQLLGTPDFTIPNNTFSQDIALFAVTIAPDAQAGTYTLMVSLQDINNFSSKTVTATISMVIADLIPPVTAVTLSPQPNAAGWNNANVVVSLASDDNAGGSGVKQISYSVAGAQMVPSTIVDGGAASVLIATEGVSIITFSAMDNAGNVEAPKTLTVKLDKTPPTIAGTRAPGPNANGWNNAPVTVSFQCADSGSGLAAGSPPAPMIVATEGAGQSVGGVCLDVAGNSAPASVENINIDLTAPTLTPPADQTVNQTSSAGAVVNYPPPVIVETGSGVLSLSCLPASGSVFPIGTTTVTCTATDLAGNSGSGTFRVTVTSTATLDGRMFGVGFINQKGQHHHFVFRVAQIRNQDYGRFEYWVSDPRFCGRDDDDDRDPNFNGDHGSDYGRDHRNPLNRFEATSITSVIFSDDPSFRPGRSPRPTVDTVRFSGTGAWNGRSGYSFEVFATDQGEPGLHRDTLSLVVRNSAGKIVANVKGDLDGGNIQSVRLAR